VYSPREFRIEDHGELIAFMERHSFATLVTVQDGVPQATQLPFIVDAARGVHGTLIAHLARANGQWQSLGHEALVIFQGPHAYVSPSWYETPVSVPTWNYMTVHARGIARVVEEEERVRAILRALVEQHEAPDSGWSLEGAEEYVASMWRRIVAFELEITSIEGKYKLSQNRSENDRRRVAAMLGEAADLSAQRLAEAMRRLLPEAEGENF